MNIALIKMQNYDSNNGPVWNADEAIDAGINEITRLLKVEAHRDILATYMAEVKAVSDGKSHNKLEDVVQACVDDTKEFNL